MMLTIEAEEAWWPPTFTPDSVARTRLAWWIMLVASHSTRRWTASSAAGFGASPSCVPPAGACEDIGSMKVDRRRPLKRLDAERDRAEERTPGRGLCSGACTGAWGERGPGPAGGRGDPHRPARRRPRRRPDRL